MGKKVSKAGKGSYASYRNAGHFAKNKKRKLERHLKSFPNDKVALNCYEQGIKGGFSYTRKSPNTPEWNHTDKHFAQVWTTVGHSGTDYLAYIKMLKAPKQPKEVNVQLVA